MKVDYCTHLIQACRADIQALKRQVQLLETAKKRRDRRARRRAEREIETFMQRIAENAPTIGRLHLRATQIADDNGVLEAWKSVMLAMPSVCREELASTGLWDWVNSTWCKPTAQLAGLPKYSFWLQFDFTLSRPYLSQDEEAFYIIDNPVRKDKVFKLPLVASQSWKGSLRSAMRLEKGWTDEQREMIRLFGNPKRAKEDFCAGRLVFFSTFFPRISLEVINPHDRETGAGTLPIYFESVPEETIGTFTLLYMPFDRVGREANDREHGLEKSLREEAADDLQAVAKGVQAMLTLYGFGAKTSSGFGVAEDDLVADEQGKKGLLQVRGLEPVDFATLSELITKANQVARSLRSPQGGD